MANELIRLAAPEGASSVHFDGDDYEVKDGFVEVPYAAVADLTGAHGYSVAGSEAAGQQAGAGAPAAKAKGNTKAATQTAPSAPAWAPQTQQ